MRVIGLALSALFVLLLASCGGGSSSGASAADAGNASAVAFGAGSKGLNAQNNARFVAGDDRRGMRDQIVGLVETARRIVERETTRALVESHGIRTGTFCTQGGFQTSVTVTSGGKSYTVGFVCSGGNITATVTTTSNLNFSCTTSGTTTQYTLLSGSSIALTIPDFIVTGGTSIASTSTITFAINASVSGGNLKSGGSTVTGSISFSYGNLSQTTSTGFCNAISTFSLTVDGKNFACSDIQSTYGSCS